MSRGGLLKLALDKPADDPYTDHDMRKHYITPTIREHEGQFVKVDDRAMIVAGVERMGRCEACGKTIKQHCGVQSPTGDLMWVGSECESVLCAADAPTLGPLALTAGERKVERFALPHDLILFAVPFLWQPMMSKGEVFARGYQLPLARNAERNVIRAMEDRGWATRREIDTLRALLIAVAPALIALVDEPSTLN